MTIQQTIEQEKEKISEHATLHSEGCCVNSEGGCDTGVGVLDCCDNMRSIDNMIDSFASTLIESDRKEIKKELMKQLGGYMDIGVEDSIDVINGMENQRSKLQEIKEI